MGLWGLADRLTKNGFPTQIIHTALEEEYHGSFDIARYIAADTLIAGISLHWFPAAAEALDLATLVKGRNPNTFVVLGGFSASFFWREILEGFPDVDGVLRGDTDLPLLDLARALSGGSRPLAEIENLAWRENGALRENPFTFSAKPEHLRDISLGNYSRYLNHYDFARTSRSFADSSALVADYDTDFGLNPIFYLLTGKGCPVNCTMCGGGRDAQYLVNRRTECLYLDDDTILRTIKEGIAHGYRRFYVCFDTTPHKPHYFYWLRKVREEGLDIDLGFGFWGLPTPEAIDELCQTSRNVLVDVSPETISEESRRRNKGFHYSNQDLYESLELLYRKRVYTHVYFSYFLPFQTEEELRDTRLAYWKINGMYPHYIEATNLKISTDPASPLYRDPERYGVQLTVTDFAEYVGKCREKPDSNILVHDVSTLSRQVQILYQRLFRFDSGLKRMFRYYTKLMIRAFPSVEEFVDYLDGFYRRTGVLDPESLPPAFRRQSEIMDQLRIYTDEQIAGGARIEPYLRDIIVLVGGVVAARESAAGPGEALIPQTAAEALPRVPRLHPGVRFLRLASDVYAAHQVLRSRKEFPSVEASPVDLLVVSVDGEVGVHRLNESMSLLCDACSRNCDATTEEILDQVASYYSDDAEEKRGIKTDLLEAVMRLARENRLLFC
jgi:radical SAM superfamily enzyme YgiQ (UPF0313 family)